MQDRGRAVLGEPQAAGAAVRWLPPPSGPREGELGLCAAWLSLSKLLELSRGVK